jgi:hypothetical protein
MFNTGVGWGAEPPNPDPRDPHINTNIIVYDFPLDRKKYEEPTNFLKFKQDNLNPFGTLALSAQSVGGAYFH